MVSTAFAATAATGPAPGSTVFTDVARDDWRDCPIDRSWIIEGRPQARIVSIAAGRDDFATTALWTCTPGTFRWCFHWDETVHLLEGLVEITMDDGTFHRLTPGSVAFFPAGSGAVWKVIEPVRKLAVCRRALPGPMAALLRLAGETRRILAGAKRRAVRALGSASPVLTFPPARYAAIVSLTLWVAVDFVFDLI